jgi:hypothetical protein
VLSTNATAADVLAALEALPSIGAGNILVRHKAGFAEWTIMFIGKNDPSLGNSEQPLLVLKTGAGAASPHATVTRQYQDVDPFSGTSAANPAMAGIISLVWQLNPTLTATQVRNLLEATAMRIGATPAMLADVTNYNPPSIGGAGGTGPRISSVATSTSGGAPARNDVFGYGLVDAGRAAARAYALTLMPELANLYKDSGERYAAAPNMGTVSGLVTDVATLAATNPVTSGTNPDTALSYWAGLLNEDLPITLNVSLQDLPDGQLAEARIDAFGPDGLPSAGTIVLDINAAGIGWFVDTTPLDHSEFGITLDGNAFQAGGDSPASGKYAWLWHWRARFCQPHWHDRRLAIVHRPGHQRATDQRWPTSRQQPLPQRPDERSVVARNAPTSIRTECPDTGNGPSATERPGIRANRGHLARRFD